MTVAERLVVILAVPCRVKSLDLRVQPTAHHAPKATPLLLCRVQKETGLANSEHLTWHLYRGLRHSRQKGCAYPWPQSIIRITRTYRHPRPNSPKVVGITAARPAHSIHSLNRAIVSRTMIGRIRPLGRVIRNKL